MARILIADDEARIRLLLGTLLRGEGHAVVEAVDGDEAAALLASQRPDLAILDVSMPGRSGLDVCRLVRADPSLRRIRVIVVSASVTEALALAAGADVFLAKPFSPRALLAAVDRLVAPGT